MTRGGGETRPPDPRGLPLVVLGVRCRNLVKHYFSTIFDNAGCSQNWLHLLPTIGYNGGSGTEVKGAYLPVEIWRQPNTTACPLTQGHGLPSRQRSCNQPFDCGSCLPARVGAGQRPAGELPQQRGKAPTPSETPHPARVALYLCNKYEGTYLYLTISTLRGYNRDKRTTANGTMWR